MIKSRSLSKEFIWGVLQGVILGLAILILAISAYFLYYKSESVNTIDYKIKLQQDDIVQGDDIILFYEIHNSYNKSTTINMRHLICRFPNEDLERTEPCIDHLDIDYTIKPDDVIRNFSKRDSANHQRGNYVYSTNISWNENGKERSSLLSLGFRIY